MGVREKTHTSPQKAEVSAETSAAPAEEEKAAVRADCVRLLLRVAVIALLSLLIFSRVFLVTRASGNDMFPAVRDGDLLLAFRLQRDYAKNDVVICGGAQGNTVGRIVALAGDIVAPDESGVLLVNGTAQVGEIPYPTFAKEELPYPYEVPPDSVFLLGDYRPVARDSRAYGAVPMENVKGKLITILRRRGF